MDAVRRQAGRTPALSASQKNQGAQDKAATGRLFFGYFLFDCMDAGGRQKTAPAFSAFTTSVWLSNAGAVAEATQKKVTRLPVREPA